MSPQKKRAVQFLILMIAISLGIVVWVFFVNVGSISVIAEDAQPFSVSIADDEMQCGGSPDSCVLTAKPGKHLMIAKREGYFDVEKEVTIKRWSTVNEKISFSFVPKIEELGELKTPTQLTDIDSNWRGLGPGFTWSSVDFTKIPKSSSFVSFSPNGKRALVISNGYFLYDGSAATAILKPFSLGSSAGLQRHSLLLAHAWSDDDYLLSLSSPTDGSAQLLQRFDFAKSMTAETVTNFERPLGKAEILAFDSSAYIIESLNVGTMRVYVVDFESKLKKRMDDLSEAKSFRKLSSALMSFEKNGKVFVRDVASGKDYEVPAMSASAVTGFENTIIFAKAEKSGSAAAGVSIEDFIELSETSIDQVKNNDAGISRKTMIEIIEKNLETENEQKLATLETESGTVILFPLRSKMEDLFLSIQKSQKETVFAIRRVEK